MEFHEAANIFPMMSDEEHGALKTDILENGLIEPIYTYQGKIIDGRNRWKACEELGIEPDTKEWVKNGSLVNFIISLNLHRRHLNSSQKAVCALAAMPELEREAKERQGARTDLSEGGSNIVEKIPQSRSRDQAAELFNTNPHYISDAKKIKETAPEKLKDVSNGNKTLTQVKREIREEKKEKRRAVNQELIDNAPIIEDIRSLPAKFSTIVIDPPWSPKDEGDADQLGRANPTYKTLSFDEISKLPIADIADVDCHIYLWITNRSLPKGFVLLEDWGFRYVVALTWCKPSIGMGNYFRGSTEHVLFGVKGSQMLKRKDVGTWFEAKRGKEHSKKPDEFYELIETCSPGPYIDIFGRSERSGWVVKGAEV